MEAQQAARHTIRFPGCLILLCCPKDSRCDRCSAVPAQSLVVSDFIRETFHNVGPIMIKQGEKFLTLDELMARKKMARPEQPSDYSDFRCASFATAPTILLAQISSATVHLCTPKRLYSKFVRSRFNVSRCSHERRMLRACPGESLSTARSAFPPLQSALNIGKLSIKRFLFFYYLIPYLP